MLVLPENLAGIEDNLEWIATELSPKIAISLLAQYRPANKVGWNDDFAEIARGITREEWNEAAAAVRRHLEGDRHHLQWGDPLP